MVYIINRYSDNSFDAGWPLSVEDKAINTNATSLSLLGRNATNYGGAVAQNFVHILENYAGTSPPNNPVTGQLWYEADAGDAGAPRRLKVFNGTDWATIQGVPVGTSLPASGSEGEFFYQVNGAEDNQLYAHDGSSWSRIGGMAVDLSPPGNNNNGDLFFNTNSNILYMYVSPNWLPLVTGDPGNNSNIEFLTVAGTGLILFKGNGNYLGAWSSNNIALGNLPASLQAVFPGGITTGYNLTNLANNKITDSITLELGNDVSISGNLIQSVEDNITAAGTINTTSYILSKSCNFVTTVTSTNNGVRLPACLAGKTITVWNLDSADQLKVYPPVGATIDSGSANVPFLLGPNGAGAVFVCRNGTNYRSIPAIY